MEDRILEICRELCGRGIAADEELIRSGILDSYNLMELICSLEDEFQIVFFPEDISNTENFSSVDKLACMIGNKIKSEENR